MPEYDDDGYEREAARPPLDDRATRRILERARCAVMAPAICFFVLGGLGFFYGAYQAYGVQQFEANWALQVKMQQANPVPAAQRQMQKDMLDAIKGPTKAMTIAAAVGCNVVAVAMIVAGVLLLKLKARTLVFVLSIVALLPVTYCCFGGIPLGIWALVLLGRREVKAGFELAARLRLQGESLTPVSVEEAFGEIDEQDREWARSRLRLPGLFLIILGLMGVAAGVIWLGVAISQPNLMLNFMKKIANLQPVPAQRDAMLAQFESQKDLYRLDRPLSLASISFGCVACLVMIVGGIQMRLMGNYSMAIAAAICATMMLHGCSIFAVPFGVWALIALTDVDVRRAFAWQAGQSERF